MKTYSVCWLGQQITDLSCGQELSRLRTGPKTNEQVVTSGANSPPVAPPTAYWIPASNTSGGVSSLYPNYFSVASFFSGTFTFPLSLSTFMQQIKNFVPQSYILITVSRESSLVYMEIKFLYCVCLCMHVYECMSARAYGYMFMNVPVEPRSHSGVIYFTFLRHGLSLGPVTSLLS